MTTQGEYRLNPDGSAPVSLTGSSIQQPIDFQSILKPLLFNTTALLAANATYTSPTIDTAAFSVGSATVSFGRITGRVRADVAGNVFMDVSDDGTAWDQVWTSAVSAAGIVQIDQIATCRYVQFRYVNGAGAQVAGFRFSGYGRPQ